MYLNTKLRKLIQYYHNILDDIESVNALSCPELVSFLKNGNQTQNHTLNSLFEEMIEHINATDSTIRVYRSCWKRISSMINCDIQAKRLNYVILINLERSLTRKGLAPTTIRHDINIFKTVVNFGLKTGYVTFKINPFLNYSLPKAEIRYAWLSTEEIKRIRDVELPKKQMQICRDSFMLSYYLGGINIVDLLEIDFNKNKSKLKYIRQKTKNKPKPTKYVEFDIPPEATEIINRYKGKDGRLKLGKNRRNLDFIHRCYLPRIAKMVGIEKIIYYSARKSFSQHAFELGVSGTVIDFIIGHSIARGSSSLYAYIHVTPEIASSAVRKVLDNLK